MRYYATMMHTVLRGYRLDHLTFADDIDFLANTRDSLQMSVSRLNRVAKTAGLKIKKVKFVYLAV